MKRNYLYKSAKYNVELKNFQDEFLRNMILNLLKNGSISLSNSSDFFGTGVSTEDENRAILLGLYELLVKPENRVIYLLEDGEIENITINLLQNNSNEQQKPIKKRGRPKGSKNKNN